MPAIIHTKPAVAVDLGLCGTGKPQVRTSMAVSAKEMEEEEQERSAAAIGFTK